MRRSRSIVTSWIVVLVAAAAPAGVSAQDRILGFATQGGLVNTKDLVVRRPAIASGSVTSQGSDYDAVGSRTESGYWNGSYTYTVAVKASGSWNAATKQAKESLVATISGYKDVPKSNGTWQFSSVATCAQDPWRFPVKCTGQQVNVVPPPGSSIDHLTAAVPYPLSAAGQLTTADVAKVTLAEVTSPKANETVSNRTQVTVMVTIHDANIASKTGQVKLEVRPYGSADFPTQQTMASYLQKSVPSVAVGGQASAWFDLSELSGSDWQAAATFIQGMSSKRSAWVRFRTPTRALGIATLLNIEAESLKMAPAGAASVQQMQQFGSGWSGNAQLFWGAKGIGDTLTLSFDVPVASAYSVELYMTRAPDFGDAEVRIGEAAYPVLKFSGFSPKVMSSGPIQMGKVELSAGTNTIRFRITGKYKDSKGFRVGIDRLRLYPAPR